MVNGTLDPYQEVGDELARLRLLAMMGQFVVVEKGQRAGKVPAGHEHGKR